MQCIVGATRCHKTVYLRTSLFTWSIGN